jgi:cytosine deaminase
VSAVKVFRNARLVRGDKLILADLPVQDGRVVDAVPDGAYETDLSGQIVLPAFVDLHTHLDKAHLESRHQNPDGTFEGAIAALYPADPLPFDEANLRHRANFALCCAHAHGTVALRSQVDSLWPDSERGLSVLHEMAQDWHGRVTISLTLLTAAAAMAPGEADGIARSLCGIAALGGVFRGADPDAATRIATMMRAAADHGLDLDLHVDETLDPASNGLETIADAAIAFGFRGRILCAHACALAAKPLDEADRILDKVARAGIALVSLPLCNRYLMDRSPGRTPRWRAGTLVHEARARGIPVAFASDNIRDPFHAYGDLDMLDVLREATAALHLDHSGSFWLDAVTQGPAALIGLPDCPPLTPGMPADFIVFPARRWTELLSRPHADRIVFRAGQRIDAKVPPYSLLGP